MPTPPDEPTGTHAPDPNATALGLPPTSPTDLEAAIGTVADPGGQAAETGSGVELPGYEIVRELGRGAMGVVYEARQAGLNRTVALKMVIAGPYAAPSTRARFLIEAEAVAALEHPHIVRVFAFGEHAGHPYLAMEHLPGGTLARHLRKRGSLPALETARMTAKLAAAVAHAHARGVVHRDIKPGNVMLTADGEPRLTDFGLAKVGRSGMTATGAVLGTPAYMSPEQAAGKTHEVGTHSDVYALGAVLYDLLTGRPPFLGNSQAATLQLVLTAEPERPRSRNAGIPRDLETICLKCLEKEPGRRYPTAQAVADDLTRFLAGQPITARPTGSVERALKWVRRNKGPTAAISAVTLALLTGTGLALWQADKAWRAEAAERARSNELSEALGRVTKAEQEERIRSEQVSDALGKVRETLGQVKAAEQATQQKANDLAEQLKESRRLRDLGRLREVGLAADNNLVGLARETLNEVAPENRRLAWGLLNRRLEGCLFTLHDHTDAVSEVAVSADSSLLVTACGGAVARVWDGRTGLPLRDLKGHADPILSLAVSGDGSRVVTGSRDKTVRVWDARTGQTLVRLAGQPGPVYGVAISADGSRVVAALQDKTARVWDAPTGRLLAELKGHTAAVTAAALSADGTRVVTGSWDGTARVWDAATGRQLAELKGHTRSVTDVAMSADGSRVVTTGDGTTFDSEGPRMAARVWDARTGAAVADLNWKTTGASAAIPIAISADGSRVATGSSDGTSRVWDAATGRQLVELKGHAQMVLGLAISADGTRLVTGSRDGTARVWDARTGGTAPQLPGRSPGVSWVALSADGTRVLAAAAGKGAGLWDARTGLAVAEVNGHALGSRCGAVNADGTRAVTSAGDATALVWDARTGLTVAELKGHAKGVVAVAISGGGTRVVTVAGDGMIRAWDASTGTLLAEAKAHARDVRGVAITADGSRAATGSDDETARLWDTATGKVLAEFKGHTGPVLGVAVSAAGSRVVTASRDGTARVWDAATGQVLAELRGHAGGVLGVAVVADGSRVVTGSADGTARVWDAATGQTLAELRGHTKAVAGVAVSADGSRVVTSSVDNTTRVWDAPTDHPVLELLKPVHLADSGVVIHSPMSAVAVSPDGSRVAVGSDDKTVRVWEVRTGKLLHELKGHAKVVLSVLFNADGSRIATYSIDRQVRVWDAATGRHLPDAPVPPLAAGTNQTPDGRYRFIAAGGRVFRLSTRVEADELYRRLWATRPDPVWHVQRQNELAAEGNAYGVAVQKCAEARARGVVAFDSGDFHGAWVHLLHAAALNPPTPKVLALAPSPRPVER